MGKPQEFEIVIDDVHYTVASLSKSLGMTVSEVQQQLFKYISGQIPKEALLEPVVVPGTYVLCGRRYTMQDLEKKTGYSKPYLYELLRNLRKGLVDESYIVTPPPQSEKMTGRPRKVDAGDGINYGIGRDRISKLYAIPGPGTWEAKHLNPQGIVNGRDSGIVASMAKCSL